MSPRHRAMLAFVVIASIGLTLPTDLAAAQPHPICIATPDEASLGGRTVREICEVIQVSSPDGQLKLLWSTWSKVLDWTPEGLSAAEILLLGEVHDNPIHHRTRAALSSGLVGWSWRQHDGTPPPVVPLVFEHIRADQQAAIDAIPRRDPKTRRAATPADHFKALDWETSGWPTSAMFEPMIAAAIGFSLPILAGDPPRATVRSVARNGVHVLPAGEIDRLGLGVRLPGPLQSALLDELAASHCGLMPSTAFAGMADAQRYRDAHLARALTDAASKHGRAILLAGNGHVRSDRGVPHYLRQMAPGKKVVSVLFLEVEDGKTDPAAYIERDPDGRPIADYIVLTPRAERADPCVEMKKRFGARGP